MKIFVTGTDTNVGKTLVSSWLCLHSGYSYFKPIQTGSILGSDSEEVNKLSGARIHKESFIYKAPLSPHLASEREGEYINISDIHLPESNNLIIEGAGGIFVPINRDKFMLDLIAKFMVPVIVVARSGLGTINHTLLTVESLRLRNIPILGVIVNGELNQDNCDAIEFYGKTKVLGQIPKLDSITKENLLNIPIEAYLKKYLEV